ncbi:MAG TPA: hypothetical protein VH253_08410 [Phycisphaerae bacterium]|nr:hypothetical protein [Phycisphaerae bacterium]
MVEEARGEVDFGRRGSRPRAGRAARVIVYLILLALACGSIWWIDRGAMLTNVRSGAATRAAG